MLILHLTHNPISIVGNSGFTNESGVVWGSGTALDPYIISNWEIAGGTVDKVVIQSTDSHFILRDCYIDGGGSMWDCIHLVDCINGTIENNTCVNAHSGISISAARNITLNHNSCIQSRWGIALAGSFGCRILNNNCSLDNWGIDVGSSNENEVGDNLCVSDAAGGMRIILSNNNTVVNNTCISSEHSGIISEISNYNALLDNNCSSNTEYGIYVWWSTNNTLMDNTCRMNSRDGMHFESLWNSTSALLCSDNVILDNQFSDNVGYGVNVFGLNNRIFNNSFIGNNGATDTHDAAHVQACDIGVNNSWNSTDGYGNYWSDWTSPDFVPPYGIVDVPYDISGSAGAKDYYPLTTAQEPIPEFGIMPVVALALLATIMLTRKEEQRKMR